MKKKVGKTRFFETVKIAKLANLDLSGEKMNQLGGQLILILDYIDQISKASTEGVDPTYNNVSPNKNVTRGDNPGACLTQEEALQNSTNTKNGQFVTKGVFESE